MRKQGKIKAAWTKDLNVLIKTLTDDVKTVKSESDVDEFKDQTNVKSTTTEVAPAKVMKPLPPRFTPVTRSKAAAMQAKPKVMVVADISSSSSSSEEDHSSDEEDTSVKSH